MKLRHVAVSGGLILFLFVATSAQAHTIECRSSGHRYAYCPADTGYSVRLVRQLSISDCRQGRSWGFDGRGVWVDNGCSAEFEVGHGDRDRYHEGGGHHHDDAGAVIAGAAAIALIAAMSNSDRHRHERHNDDYGANVPGWAVGTFSGGDNQAGADMSLSVSPHGQVSGYYGHSRLDGQFNGEHVWLGNRGYFASPSRNGMRLTADDDSGMVIFLYRD
jgi:hypothetical protein